MDYSVGCSSFVLAQDKLDDVIKIADEKMYKMKQESKKKLN